MEPLIYSGHRDNGRVSAEYTGRPIPGGSQMAQRVTPSCPCFHLQGRLEWVSSHCLVYLSRTHSTPLFWKVGRQVSSSPG